MRVVGMPRGAKYLCRLRPMRVTYSLVLVAVQLMSDQAGKHWGYELSRRSGVRTGVLYPILSRMLQRGWLTDGWESADEAVGRRARRYYELTDVGRRELGAILVEARQDPRFVPILRWS